MKSYPYVLFIVGNILIGLIIGLNVANIYYKDNFVWINYIELVMYIFYLFFYNVYFQDGSERQFIIPYMKSGYMIVPGYPQEFCTYDGNQDFRICFCRYYDGGYIGINFYPSTKCLNEINWSLCGLVICLIIMAIIRLGNR